ncbi:MAG TPA: tetratricopeptide repeat protein, partial [Wenzhouxiangella sp.]|nr:tetratricopeptide repeat protein [Wenzhouxiangella sp.]
ANVRAALHAALAMALAGQGQADKALSEARRAVALVPATADAAEGPVWLEYLARVYVQTGQLDQAESVVRELLDKSYLHPLTLAFVQIDPAWDRIADRFAAPREPDSR